VKSPVASGKRRCSSIMNSVMVFSRVLIVFPQK
jgi:hypothetical protein